MSPPSGGASPPPPARASACVAPTPDAVAQAKAAHQLARTAFNQGDYVDAISDWRRAYSYDCMATALPLDLARAEEMQGDVRGAA